MMILILIVMMKSGAIRLTDLITDI